jgi:hypothetical protein
VSLHSNYAAGWLWIKNRQSGSEEVVSGSGSVSHIGKNLYKSRCLTLDAINIKPNIEASDGTYSDGFYYNGAWQQASGLTNWTTG